MNYNVSCRNLICIIGAYFGELPSYFDLWLRSCSFNSNIDFVFFTDQSVKVVPINVRVIHTTFDNVVSLAKQKLGFELSLKSPYKLCDFKVVYGLIFEDYIKNYSYWAHTDIDLLYGDISHFLRIYNLEVFDKFLPLGHLCFYRNTKDVLSYIKLPGSKLGNYLSIYKNNENVGFDELNGIFSIYKENNLSMFDKIIFFDITPIYKELRLISKLPIAKDCINYKYQVFYWEKGKIFRAFIRNNKVEVEEQMYIHFQKRRFKALNFDCFDCQSFYIIHDDFIPKSEGLPPFEDIKKYSQVSFFESLMHSCYFYKMRIRRKFARINNFK